MLHLLRTRLRRDRKVLQAFLILYCIGSSILSARSESIKLDKVSERIMVYEELKRLSKDVGMDSLQRMELSNSYLQAYRDIMLFHQAAGGNYEVYDSLRISINCEYFFELTADPYLSGHFINAESRLYRDNFMSDQATSMYGKSMKIFKSMGENGLFAYMNTMLHAAIGHQYYGGDLDSAEYYNLRLQDYIDEYGDDGFGMEYRNTYCLAALYRLKTNLEYALYWAKRAKNLVLSESELSLDNLADIEVVIANIEFERINYEKAEASFLKGIGIKKDLDPCSEDLLYFYNSYMTYLVKLGKSKELEIYIDEFQSLPGSQSRYWTFILSKHKGYLYLLNGNYERAAREMLLGIQSIKNMGHNDVDVSLLNELIGYSYYFNGEYDKSYKYFKEALNAIVHNEESDKNGFQVLPREIYLEAYAVFCNMLFHSENGENTDQFFLKLESIQWDAVLSSIFLDPISRFHMNSAMAFVYDLLLTYKSNYENDRRVFELVNNKKGGIERSLEKITACWSDFPVGKLNQLDLDIRVSIQENHNSDFSDKNSIVKYHNLIRDRELFINSFLDSSVWPKLKLCLMGKEDFDRKESIKNTLILSIYFNENFLVHNELVIASKYNDSYKSLRIELNDKELNFLNKLSNYSNRVNLVKEENDMLYDLILLPFAEEIKTANDIVVINDGPFYSFPIGSIRDKSTQRPLYLDKTVTYAFDYESISDVSNVKVMLNTLGLVTFTDEQSIISSIDKGLRELPGTFVEGLCARDIFDKTIELQGQQATWKKL